MTEVFQVIQVFEVCVAVLVKGNMSVSMSSVSLSIYQSLCTPTQPICIHIISFQTQTQLELNPLPFL